MTAAGRVVEGKKAACGRNETIDLRTYKNKHKLKRRSRANIKLLMDETKEPISIPKTCVAKRLRLLLLL